MREIDELRPLTAGRLLHIWDAARKAAKDPLERVLRCNAEILAESCFFQGEPAFQNRAEVLGELTGRQMEMLLRTLAVEESPSAAGKNPAFDRGRFEELQGEEMKNGLRTGGTAAAAKSAGGADDRRRNTGT